MDPEVQIAHASGVVERLQDEYAGVRRDAVCALGEMHLGTGPRSAASSIYVTLAHATAVMERSDPRPQPEQSVGSVNAVAPYLAR